MVSLNEMSCVSGPTGILKVAGVSSLVEGCDDRTHGVSGNPAQGVVSGSECGDVSHTL